MNRSRLVTILLLTAALATFPSRADAAHFLRGPNAVGVRIGGQGSWADWTPAGFKLNLFYDRHLKGRTWLNFQFNFVAGNGGHDCDWVRIGGDWEYVCSDWWGDHYGWTGNSFELAVGGKWKFKPWRPNLVLYPKAGGTINLLDFPGGVFGVGIAFRGGGGMTYYFLRNFGAGIEVNVDLGFSFVDHDVGLELLWAIDFLVGVELLF